MKVFWPEKEKKEKRQNLFNIVKFSMLIIFQKAKLY